MRGTIVLESVDRQYSYEAEAEACRQAQEEFADPWTTVEYTDRRGAGDFATLMRFSRMVGSLPPQQLFALKWVRMNELVGLYQTIWKHEYQGYMAQMYVGVLHGDGGANVQFIPTKTGGSWLEENRGMVNAKCLDYYTPYLTDVLRSVVNAVDEYAKIELSTGEFMRFAREQMGGGSQGWASSR